MVRAGIVATELALVFVAAYLAVDLAHQLMRPMAPAVAFASQEVPRIVERPRRVVTDYDVITERDIFNPPKHEVSEAAPPAPPPNMKFVGTAPSDNPNRARAVLEDLATQEQEHRQAMYRTGDQIRGWVVAKIEWDRVTLSNGMREYVIAPAFTREHALRWGGGTVKEKVAVGDRTYPLGSLATAMRLRKPTSRDFRRAEPIYEAGTLAGLQLLGITKGSELEKIGLKGGDVVTTVNGSPISDPAAAVALLTTLGSLDKPSLVVSRADVTIALPR